MEFDEAVFTRKSVRSFTKKKPSWKHILDAIETVNEGPFAGNHNNLKFLIVEDGESISKISSMAEQSWIKESPILVLFCSDDANLENLYGDRGRVYSRQQAGSAIQTFLLKITDLGLSACWIGAYSDELIKQFLKIPQYVQVEAIVSVGYENKKLSTRKRAKKELENSIYWEQWKNDKRPTIFKEPKDPLSLKN